MSTTMLTKETVERKWYVLDAAGKPLGKTAAIAADLLHHHQRFQGCPHRQQDGAEVLSYSLRLGRRSEGDSVQAPDGKSPRAGNASCSSRHASEEHHRSVAAQAPARFRRCRAHPCSSEARSLGSLIGGREYGNL